MSDSSKKDLTGLHEIPLSPIADEKSASITSSEHLFETSPETVKIDSFEVMESEELLIADSESFQETVTTTPLSPMETVREVSERVSIAPTAEPDYPFSLRINGKLNPDQREKLCELLSREKTGIREVDLEPQFESNRIFIPRISEFMGVLLVQALRSAHVTMDLSPSDAPDSHTASSHSETEIPNSSSIGRGSPHPAETLPVTAESCFSGKSSSRPIDVVTASTTVSASAVESKGSSEYQEILDSLHREIRYKAYRKGADAIVGFAIQLQPLAFPTRYRLTVSGTAVKTFSH